MSTTAIVVAGNLMCSINYVGVMHPKVDITGSQSIYAHVQVSPCEKGTSRYAINTGPIWQVAAH